MFDLKISIGILELTALILNNFHVPAQHHKQQTTHETSDPSGDILHPCDPPEALPAKYNKVCPPKKYQQYLHLEVESAEDSGRNEKCRYCGSNARARCNYK